MLMRSRLELLLATSFALALIGLGLFAHTTRAQFDPITSPDVSINVTPDLPGPYDQVYASLSSLSYNLDIANITWTLDGKLVLQGIGKKLYNFKVGDVGVASTLIVRIEPLGAPAITKNVVLTPQGIDLLWQAKDSIVPPLYRGKALPAKESVITFVAIPGLKDSQGSLVSQNNLLYLWKHGSEENSATGYGQDAFSVKLDYLDTEARVAVTASTRDGGLQGQNSTTVIPFDPKIVWYESNSLYGPLYNTAIPNNYTLAGSDMTLIAEPYFFSPKSIYSHQLKYTWTLNDAAIDTPVIPTSVALHRSDQSKGIAVINVAIENVNKLFQTANSTLSINLQ